MAEVKVVVTGQDNLSATFGRVAGQIRSMESSVSSLTSRITSLAGSLGGLYIGNKLLDGFAAGIKVVDDFQQSVIKTSAMITSLQGGDSVADNYRKAKEYAENLQNTLVKVDSQTSLNVIGLQAITEEMVKQGVILDTNNADQVEAFTRVANAAAIYSQNGRNEVQLRQEVGALMKGQVDQNSQLASMLQRTVDGPLDQQVQKWKQSGTLLEELGKHLTGFGPANQDMQNIWSAVKSSLETSVNLVSRAGFGDVVKDIVEQVGTLNEYIKAHKDMIAGEIKHGWEEMKSLMSSAAEIAKTIFNNFEPFAVLFIAGTLLKGISSAITLMKELRTVATTTVAIMTGANVASAAGVGTAGAAAGASAGMLARGGGVLLRGAGAVGMGIALGYAAQPLVRWVDKKLYQNFGVNLTGEEMYNEAQNREAATTARLNAVMARRVSGQAGAYVPVVNLGETTEQAKKAISLQEKGLAVFKENQERMTAIAKAQSEVQLEDLKGRYQRGMVSTAAYYEEEKRIAVDAARKKLSDAQAYLEKEQAMLATIRGKMKGTDSAEYQEELAKNYRAQQAVTEAELGLKKTELAEDNKMQEALQTRSKEYSKLIAQAQEESGQYVQAAETRINAEKKTMEYLRLQVEALSGVQGAVDALAVKEREYQVQRQESVVKENEAARSFVEATLKMRDELDALLGKDADRIRIESELREGTSKLLALQDKLILAISQSNMVAISGLQQQIELQKQLNAQKLEQQAIQERDAVLSGSIVGFNGDTPIYASGSASGGYSNGSAVPAYQSYSSSVNISSGSSSVKFLSIADLNKTPFLGGFATGTNYVPADGYAFLHKGEAVVPKAYNPGVSSNHSVNLNGDINITIQGGKTTQESAEEIARKIFPIIRKYQGRQLLAV